jgi:hypothetical protein
MCLRLLGFIVRTFAISIISVGFLFGGPTPRHKTHSAHGLSAGLGDAHRMEGGFWRVDHTFEPMLIVSNVLEKAELPVSPILYAADGTEFRLPSITIAPSGVASIDIRNTLKNVPPEIRAHFSQFGSAAIEYVWSTPGAASAMIQNRDAKRSLNFNSEFRASGTMRHGQATNTHEGMWWKDDAGVTGFLALINTAGRSLRVQVRILSQFGAFEGERSFELQAKETQVLDPLEGIPGGSGGIQVTYDGSENDVSLEGGLENALEGYSAQMPFFTRSSPTKPSAVSVSSVGLMFGNPEPMMKFPAKTTFGVYLALRNVTEHAISVTPTLYYMNGPDVRNKRLKTLTLSTRQTKYWAPEDFANELGLSDLSGMINLVFSYFGGPSDVLIANGSVDQTKTYVFESRLKAVAQSQAKDLKDWDVSNGNDTMISLLNLGGKEQDLVATLFFDGGHYKYPVRLGPGGSAMFNISDIIMMEQSDSEGNKIPADTPHGTAILSGSEGYTELINVAVGVGVFNVSTATCGNRCPTCLGMSAFRVQPDKGTVPVGQMAQFSSWGLLQTGVWGNITLLSTWTSSNPQVATSGSPGYFTGVAQGTFNAQASANLLDVHPDCGATGSPCPFTPYSDSAPGKIGSTLPAPDHVVVVVDQEGFAAQCPAGTTGLWLRQMLMQVVDVSNIPLTWAPSIGEAYNPTAPANSCPGHVSPIPTSCRTTGLPCTSCTISQFLDSMTVSACSSTITPGSGCGFTLTSVWSACASSGTNTIWTSTRVTHSNGVSVNGQASVFPPGTIMH